MAQTTNRVSVEGTIIQIICICAVNISAVAVIINSCVLGIVDIVIAKLFADSPCHITYLSIYLYIFGTFSLINMIFVLFIKKDKPRLLKAFWVIVMIIMIVVPCWGMALVWNTDRGNCPALYYNYAYYRTVIYMFLGLACLCIAVIISLIKCYDYINASDKLNSQIALDKNEAKLLELFDIVIKNMHSNNATNITTMESVV